MSGSLTLQGTLTAAPACGGGSTFPSSIDNIQLDTNPPGSCGGKPYAVKTGTMQANVANVAYAALGGIGAGGPVTLANFFYLRSIAPMQVRLTKADASQSVEEVSGLLVVETSPSKEITLVEVIGTGFIEYFAAGAQ